MWSWSALLQWNRRVQNDSACLLTMDIFVDFILLFLKKLLSIFQWKNYAPLLFKTDACISKGNCRCIIQSAIIATVIRNVLFHSVCETQQTRNKVRASHVRSAQKLLKWEWKNKGDIRENTKKLIGEWGIKQFSSVNLMFLSSRWNQRTLIAA